MIQRENAIGPQDGRALLDAFKLLRLLCRALSDNPAAHPLDVLSDATLLEALFNFAVEQGVMPALHLTIGRNPASPLTRSARAVLLLRYEANKRRNRLLRETMGEIATAAARRGLTLMALKGAAWVLEDPSEFAAWRAMIDLDLLAPEAQFSQVPALLGELGFRPVQRRRRFFGTRRFAGHFHHIPYRRAGDPFTVEVHRHVGWDPRILPTATMFEHSRSVAPGLSIPAPWSAALHAIAHWQVQHDAFRRGEPQTIGGVKCALDVARFLKRTDVDWFALAAYAQSVGLTRPFEAGVGLAAELFAINPPAGVVPDEVGARRASFLEEIYSSPAYRWRIARRARISAVWDCARPMYRLHLHTRNRAARFIALWSLRFLRLPLVMYLAAGLAAAALVPSWVAMTPSPLGRA
jgi:hypothetical protein